MSTVTSADGTTIAFETRGSGPTVVLVDGAMCFRRSGPMPAIADQLESAHTVVLYDRRGRGESGDAAPYDLEREVEDLAALVGMLGGPVRLFGMSSGGALVLRAAAALSDSVSKVALYEVPYSPDGALPAAAAYTADLTTALASDDRDGAVTAFLRRVGTPDPAIERIRTSPGWSAMTAIAPTLGYDDALMSGGVVPADLVSSLVVPVLCLAGGASPDFLRYGAATVADLAPKGRFELVEAAGHDVPVDRLAAHLLPFFAAT
ncbi:MAG: alpha/beta hydrolase [Actinomycetota bacterium]|nr:alpha/beta hydrolase [Actinomycetota bacterium]